MFFGSYEHTLDDKGRLVLPSRLRNNLGNKLFILKGYEGSLSLYKEEEFKSYIDSLSSLPYSSKNNRDIVRIALSSVFELNLDSQYRIQIPQALINKYQIEKEVVIIGVIDHLEIWNKSKWDKYQKDNDKEFEEKSERLFKNE